MSESTCPGGCRVELFVRSDVPTPSERRRAAIEARLEELDRQDHIEQFETTTWEKRVPVDGCGDRVERNRYNEFSAWARSEGVCLAPFFDTRECYSPKTGEKETHLVMPVICLAVYEGDELTRVAPFAAGSGTESVEECLTELATEAEVLPELSATFSTAD